MAYYEVFLNPQSSDFNPNSPVKVQAETVEFFGDHGDYNFFSTAEEDDNEPVFVVPAHQVRYIQRFGDDEPSDICLGCEFKELLGSEDFFDAVYDIVDSYHEPDEPESLTVFKATVKGTPTPQWGFWYEDRKKGSVFVNFSEKGYAEGGLETHKKLSNPEGFWGTHPLSNVIPVEETIQ